MTGITSTTSEISDEAIAIWVDGGIGGTVSGRDSRKLSAPNSWWTCHSKRVTGDRYRSQRPFLFVRVPGTIGQVTGYLA